MPNRRPAHRFRALRRRNQQSELGCRRAAARQAYCRPPHRRAPACRLNSAPRCRCCSRRSGRRHRPWCCASARRVAARSCRIERVAINVDDARIPDNAGACPIDAPIVADGPAAYFATLPIKAMLAALREAGIPAEISQTAGTYVCNHVFYGLMHALRGKPRIRGGFIHIPYSPDQAARHPGAPSLPVEVVTRALRIAIAHRTDHPTATAASPPAPNTSRNSNETPAARPAVAGMCWPAPFPPTPACLRSRRRSPRMRRKPPTWRR